MIQGQERLHAIIIGRVQGVSFRYYTVQKAEELQISGWAMNRPDGRSVEVIAEGNRSNLEALLHWLHQGSPAAKVERVEHSWQAANGEFSRFRVRYQQE